LPCDQSEHCQMVLTLCVPDKMLGEGTLPL
jgi:hypothetical protein